ncbi:MAG: TetR/AcrR family transcriptional regulator [Parvularcula sp.]|nr:TetR/AcrR family transcriptional regulator [Parvularcula sp.]
MPLENTLVGAERVVGAATALFLEKGYAGTSMAQVAREAGMQKASLYHHFESKEALFVACVTAGYDAVLDRMRDVRDRPNLSHEEKLRSALDIAHETIVLSSVGRMSPLIAETSRSIPEVARSFWEQHIALMHELVWSIVERGIREGAFRKIDRTTFELMLFGPIVYLSLSNQMFGRFEDLAAHFEPEHCRRSHKDAVMRFLEIAE